MNSFYVNDIVFHIFSGYQFTIHSYDPVFNNWSLRCKNTGILSVISDSTLLSDYKKSQAGASTSSLVQFKSGDRLSSKINYGEFVVVKDYDVLLDRYLLEKDNGFKFYQLRIDCEHLYTLAGALPSSSVSSNNPFFVDPAAFLDWKIGATHPNGKCKHEMKFYQGFSEEYNYCTKCDHKEPKK